MSGRIFPSYTPVSVLRDTGYSTCVIKSSVVKPEQNISVKEFPVAKIGIDSTFTSGEIQALCMPKCLCKVVIGNRTGSRTHVMLNEKNFEVPTIV